ncbi:selina-4(15),7(11)-diene synthase [Streptomyces natalensis]|uniref:selina-4(15),7(11)-diene synthase n=1 Tax=Streptomyces natalensis TaxID=68242 RepID=UPI001F52976D|nr:selina-4(15),7(11)-diene synthase [Streptomyces natalensis]
MSRPQGVEMKEAAVGPDLIPALWAPIPPAIHPRHADINAATTRWAHAYKVGSPQLRGRLVTQDIGRFAARILPQGDENVITLLSDFVLWLFGVDDGHCEEGTLGRRPGELTATLHELLRIAQQPQAPMLVDDPLAAALRDLSRRVDRHATPAQATRWVDALREYFWSVVWEAHHRAAGTVPSLSDYTLMRLYDGATTVVLPLLEMGHGYALDADERDHPAVRAAGEMASFVITWDNDLLSHHKEHHSGDYYLNVIRVLEHETGCTTNQALATAVAQRDRVLRLFLRLRTHLQAHAGPELCQYLDSLGQFIRASQDWGITSLRYTTPDDPAPLPSAFRSEPTDDSDDPLDIPVIREWWSLLPATSHETVSAYLAPMTGRLTHHQQEGFFGVTT